MASASSTDLSLTSEGGGCPASLPAQAPGISLTLQETSDSPTRGMDCDDERPDAEGGAHSVSRSASVTDSISDSVSEYGSPLAEAVAVKTTGGNSVSPCSSPSKLSTYHTPPQSPLPPPSRLTKSSSTLGGYPGANELQVDSDIRRHAGHTLFAQQQQQHSSGEGSRERSGDRSGEPSGERSGECSRERFRRRSADSSADCFLDSPVGSPADRSADGFAERSAERSAERFARRSGRPGGPGMGGRSRRYTVDVVSGGRGGRRDGDAAGNRGRGVGDGETAVGGEEEGDEGDKSEEQQGQGNGRVAQIAEGLLWVQKHPVLSAVIWMFGKVLDPGGDGAEGEHEGKGGGKEGGYVRGDGARGCLRGDDNGSPGRGRGGAGEALLSGGSSGDFERGSAAPRFLWRRHSKGRLSWSDDYGGCLAEYYEDQRVRSASDSSSVPTSDPPPAAAAAGGGGGGDNQSLSEEAAPHTAASAALASFPADEAAVARSRDNSEGAAGGGGKEGASSYPEENSGKFAEELRVDTSAARRGNGKECAGEQRRDNAGGAEEGGAGAAGGSLVHNGTSYGGVRDAMLGQKWGQGEGNAVQGQSGENPSGQGNTLPPPKPADDGGGFLPHTSSSAGEGGIGVTAGMPPGSGAGTWSPQWGWYVSMTPPQDMYPTAPGAGPAVKAAASPSGPSEAPTSLKGRPPRP